MSGTDPNGRWFQKKVDATSPFSPPGEVPPDPPENLPKVPGITLHHEIARGGMGVVYAGRQDFLDRRVAVKFLSVELGGEAFQKRFQREAKILAGISHPNIVGCHMADATDDGQSYLVMEFIDGPSLKAWVQDNGPVAPLASLRLVRATAQALAHAHLSDIIHRDVKPENILLETMTSTAIDMAFPFTPKLVDLGLARMTHEQVGMGLTSPGSVMGTPATMSPEQFDDPDSVDFRSDIYGLGCVLYEMLVGQPAFRGNKLTEIVVRKRAPVAPDPREENGALPAAVGAFCQRLLASNRDDRPSSYKEFDAEIVELMRVVEAAGQGRGGPASDDLDLSGQTGATIPNAFIPGAGATKPVGGPAPGAAASKPVGNTAPGMLNTGELNFLSDGGGFGDGSGAATAFRDGAGDTAAAPRQTVAGTDPGRGGSGGGSRVGLWVGLGALAAIGGGVGIWLAMNDGGGDGTDGGGGPAVANTRPVIRGTDAPDRDVERDVPFTLSVDAVDEDGDALSYAWSIDYALLSPMSAIDKSRITLELHDGLEGTPFVVSCLVDDGNGEPVPVDFPLTAGPGPVVRTLLRWQQDPAWTAEEGKWVERELDLPAVGTAPWRGDEPLPAMLAASLRRDGAYWEWSGQMLPTVGVNPAQDEVPGIGQVQVEFGDRAYAIQCVKTEDAQNEEATWSVELVTRTPGTDEWVAVVNGPSMQWNQPGSDHIHRALWQIRREGRTLSFGLGQFVQVLRRDGSKPEPTPTMEEPFSIDLSEAEAAALGDGTLRLVTRQARCEFDATCR